QSESARRRFDAQDVYVPWTLNPSAQQKSVAGTARVDSDAASVKAAPVVFQRYYHVFVKGELEALVRDAAGPAASITASGYDRDNWYLIARKA
ncbi:tRNA methyltransferase, has a role in tRNA modification, partial [Cladochytrium tenue]